MFINAIIGTGFFGILLLASIIFLVLLIIICVIAIPYAYYHSGLILSVIITVFCSLFSALAAIWV